ncbi:MAG: DUF3515 family protein [Actinomycetales bacterium]|nr:DUF3515 family protein [Actinomycetales bacterium]
MSRPRRARLALAVSAALLAGLALAGCSPSVVMHPADDANNPDCAAVTVRLPDTLGDDLGKRSTDAQATAAWGDPPSVLLSCGVPVPAASELPCIEVNGIQWLRDDSAAPNYAFTTFGRDPAVLVAIDSQVLSPGIPLDQLANAVSFTPTNGLECRSLEDTVTGQDLFPSDAPTDAPAPGEATPSATPAP